MSNWTLQIQFTSGTTDWVDISDNVLYDSIEKDEQLIGSAYKAADDLFRFSVKHDSTLTTSLFSADELIKFNAQTSTGGDIFTGAISPEISQQVDEFIGNIEIEAYDNGYLLDKPLSASIMYPSTVNGTPYAVFATSSTGASLIHALLTTAGYSTGQIGTTGSVLNTVEMVCELEGDATYRDIIDQLMWEHGYTYRFDESGIFQSVALRFSTVTASHTFGSSNIAISPPLSRDKILFEDEAVEVVWSETQVRDGATVVLYDESADRDDYGSYSGDLFSTGGVWPSSSTGDVYQNYDLMYYDYHGVTNRRNRRADLGG